MRRRYTSDRGQGFRRRFGAGSFGCSLLKVFSASLLSVHVCRSFDPLAAQDGTVHRQAEAQGGFRLPVVLEQRLRR